MTYPPDDHARASRQKQQGPQSDSAALIRDRLAVRRQRLDVERPEALDLAAEVLAALHAALSGELSHLAADHPPRYLRGQILGEHGLALEDLCLLAVRRPREVAVALRALLDLAEGLPAPARPSAAAADLARSAGELIARVTEAVEDSIISATEADSIRSAIGEMEYQLSRLRAAIRRSGC